MNNNRLGHFILRKKAALQAKMLARISDAIEDVDSPFYKKVALSNGMSAGGS